MIEQYSDFFRDAVLLPADEVCAAGLAYHLADIFMTELKALAAESPPGAEALAALLRPFSSALQSCGHAIMLERIKSTVFDELLEELADPGEGRPLRHLDWQVRPA